VTGPAELAPAMPDWPALAAAACRCTACAELAATRTQVVVGVRPATTPSGVLLVGEAPGAQEDAAGVPFVGRAGRLLDELLAEAGLPRDRVAVANVLKCRPPGNRRPTRTEVATCRPWLDRQVELVDPRVVVTLGGTAAEWALGRSVRIAEARREVLDLGGRRLLVTYHPAAALRFGPSGAPRAALLEDLNRAAALAAVAG